MNALGILMILVPIVLIVCALHAILFHKQSRDRLETGCVKESHLQTFVDNFVSNAIIILPIILAITAMSVIAGAFS